MIACIQTVPSRLEAAERQRKALDYPCAIHIDDMTGPFNGFVDSLRKVPSGDQYRLHMQDDIILADDFKDYIPQVQKIMEDNGMHLMSLYAPRHKQLRDAYAKGRPFCQSFAGFAMPCIAFSPFMVEKMLEYAPYYTQSKHDDWFVSEVCVVYRIKAYVHLPSITQHNVWDMKSSMGHAQNDRRTSDIFEKNFVTKWKQSQNLT
jgi:hypothetical protein